jgi:hypothetical protein
MTAPSGYAVDLLQPLQRLRRSGEVDTHQIFMLASDLDPEGDMKDELKATASELGFSLEFVPGNLTTVEMRETLKRSGPYDMIFFVGLSTWIAKTHLLSYLKLIRRSLLAPGGILFVDCFTPQAFALTGHYVGYKANYYSPREFTHILAYCGFEPDDMAWTSEPQGITHVCVARLSPKIAIRSRVTPKINTPLSKSQ